jgi:Family of unknown function (DUF6527)
VRATQVKLKRTVASRADAGGLLCSPGDAVLIERGVPRWLLIACPCGCGEEFPINLDDRAGPAWHIYRSPKDELSIFPSVWRDSGCKSHYIVWRNHVYLFGDYYDSLDDFRGYPGNEDLNRKVLDALSSEGHIHFAKLADDLAEIPWDVLAACRTLVRRGLATEGVADEQGAFSRARIKT